MSLLGQPSLDLLDQLAVGLSEGQVVRVLPDFPLEFMLQLNPLSESWADSLESYPELPDWATLMEACGYGSG